MESGFGLLQSMVGLKVEKSLVHQMLEFRFFHWKPPDDLFPAKRPPAQGHGRFRGRVEFLMKIKA
jgi:hypothetical protein